MNLYCVYPRHDEWVCYVFAETRNQAKSFLAGHFHSDHEYCDFNVRTIKKDVGGSHEVCEVDCERLALLGVKYEEVE